MTGAFQHKRNKEVFKTKELAIKFIYSMYSIPEIKDGSVVLSRYFNSTGEVETLIGVYFVDKTGKNVTIYDAKQVVNANDIVGIDDFVDTKITNNNITLSNKIDSNNTVINNKIDNINTTINNKIDSNNTVVNKKIDDNILITNQKIDKKSTIWIQTPLEYEKGDFLFISSKGVIGTTQVDEGDVYIALMDKTTDFVMDDWKLVARKIDLNEIGTIKDIIGDQNILVDTATNGTAKISLKEKYENIILVNDGGGGTNFTINSGQWILDNFNKAVDPATKELIYTGKIVNNTTTPIELTSSSDLSINFISTDTKLNTIGSYADCMLIGSTVHINCFNKK